MDLSINSFLLPTPDENAMIMVILPIKPEQMPTDNNVKPEQMPTDNNVKPEQMPTDNDVTMILNSVGPNISSSSPAELYPTHNYNPASCFKHEVETIETLAGQECSRLSDDKSLLDVHARIHDNESQRPFKCTECAKVFTQAGNFLQHMRTHTEEKPYKCKECHKAFTQSGDLKMHMRTHTGEKPYKCDVCDKAFTQKGNWKKHMRTHTG